MASALFLPALVAGSWTAYLCCRIQQRDINGTLPKAKEQTATWKQPLRVSNTVKGDTTVVRMADGSVRKFNLGSNAIAREITQGYALASTNKEVSAEIQNIRNMILSGDDQGAIDRMMSYAQELAGEAGLNRKNKAVSPLAQAMNGYFGQYILLGKKEAESIARSYGSVTKANEILANAGVKARMTANDKVGSALDEIYSGQYDDDQAVNDLRNAIGSENDTPAMEDVLDTLDH